MKSRIEGGDEISVENVKEDEYYVQMNVMKVDEDWSEDSDPDSPACPARPGHGDGNTSDSDSDSTISTSSGSVSSAEGGNKKRKRPLIEEVGSNKKMCN